MWLWANPLPRVGHGTDTAGRIEQWTQTGTGTWKPEAVPIQVGPPSGTVC